MKTFLIFTSFRISFPRSSSTGSPSWARSPPWMRKSAGGFMAWPSFTARASLPLQLDILLRRVLQLDGLLRGFLRLHRHRHFGHVRRLLPGDERVRAGRHVRDGKAAVLPCHGVVRVLGCIHPAEHPAVHV